MPGRRATGLAMESGASCRLPAFLRHAACCPTDAVPGTRIAKACLHDPNHDPSEPSRTVVAIDGRLTAADFRKSAGAPVGERRGRPGLGGLDACAQDGSGCCRLAGCRRAPGRRHAVSSDVCRTAKPIVQQKALLKESITMRGFLSAPSGVADAIITACATGLT